MPFINQKHNLNFVPLFIIYLNRMLTVAKNEAKQNETTNKIDRKLCLLTTSFQTPGSDGSRPSHQI